MGLTTELYMRPTHEVEHSTPAHEVRLGHDGSVRFDSYFNMLGVGKLLRHTTVQRAGLAVQVSGACRLEVVHDRLDQRGGTVVTSAVESSEPTWFDLALPPLQTLGGGALYLKVNGLDGSATLHDAFWRTPDQAGRSARLGIVITTFNRPQYVHANIRRLLDALADAPCYKDLLEVVVVDNGRNLGLVLRDGDPVAVLPNLNTGGAGGYARGLHHFRDRPDITHVLFMDDDVTFDPEIVFRTIQLLSFAKDPLLCVAGAMLREDVPTEQFEAGARFLAKAVYPTRAVGQGVDLTDWDNLLRAEETDDQVDYGAWWFFAFPVTLTSENPFPAFVRGDDVWWGLRHAGQHTVTFNGVGLWHGDFVFKNGPLSWFYDTRNFALISVLLIPGYQWWHLLWRYLNTCGRSLLSFKYTSAGHITDGLKEFLRGPEHWLALDQAKLNEIVASYDQERPKGLGPELMAVEDLPLHRRAKKAVLALLSAAVLGGHVLPGWMHRAPIGAAPMQDRALEAATLRKEILYRDNRRTEGFVARRDRRRFFSLLFEMIVTALRVPFRFGAVKRAYRDAYPRMVSDEYWKQQFSGQRVP
jgi:glycosyltransferase involved in cell wall biosynthesis